MVFKNDIELISALKKGIHEAYIFLVDNYHHKLCIYAYGLTNDPYLAEDIVQNIFVYLWKNRLNLKSNFSVKNYLHRAVYNEFIDQYRKKKTVIALEKKYIDALSNIAEEEDRITTEKLIALVKQEIENLPKKCKRTFLLSKQEGLTNLEIAEHLNISVKTVEYHITKALNIIRKKAKKKTNHILFFIFGNHFKPEYYLG